MDVSTLRMPHIYLSTSGYWICHYRARQGYGRTPAIAYCNLMECNSRVLMRLDGVKAD